MRTLRQAEKVDYGLGLYTVLTKNSVRNVKYYKNTFFWQAKYFFSHVFDLVMALRRVFLINIIYFIYDKEII